MNQKTFRQIEIRLRHFIAYAKHNLERKSHDCKKDNCITEYNSPLVHEEGLFLALLITIFDNEATGKAFHSLCEWHDLNSGNFPIRKRCTKFFKNKVTIGGHRRYFRTRNNKSEIMVLILKSYLALICNWKSQHLFYCDKNRTFDSTFNDLSAVETFKWRLPRWDLIERVSSLPSCNITPDRMYLEVRNYSGPFKGLLYILTDKRGTNTVTPIEELINSEFELFWNGNRSLSQFGTIDSTTSWKKNIVPIEQWLIKKCSLELQPYSNKRNFLFLLESLLCNWQKKGMRGHQ